MRRESRGTDEVIIIERENLTCSSRVNLSLVEDHTPTSSRSCLPFSNECENAVLAKAKRRLEDSQQTSKMREETALLLVAD